MAEKILTSDEEQALTESQWITEMANSQGYEKVFKPFLIAKRDQSFPDPVSFTKDEEFVYAAKVASVFKKVCAEILLWVEQQKEQSLALEAKKKGKGVDPFNIGS
ncbi:MAG TPA: hypothetical protein VF974_07475 [Patescibacteria group bacterium]